MSSKHAETTNQYSFREQDDFADIPIIPNKKNSSSSIEEGIYTQKLPNPDVIDLSDNEFAHDIWLFELSGNSIRFKGVYHDGLIQKIEELGIYKRYRDNNSYFFVRDKDNVLSTIEISQIKDEVLGYVRSMNKPITLDYRGLRIVVRTNKLNEAFLNFSERHLSVKFLEHLRNHDIPILRDTKTEAFFPFRNAIFQVNADGVHALPYRELDGKCLWVSHIKQHELIRLPDWRDCHFVRFLRNVTCNDNARFDAFCSAIGYLLHNHSDPSRGQAVIAYDEEISDLNNPMGGTGKGLFANGLKQMRDVVKIDGKKFDPKDKFRYQEVKESSQIVWLDDVKPELGFDVFHSCLTDGWTIERKYEGQFQISPDESPKMFITSNAILSGNGTTNRRRQFILEFGDYYSKQIRNGHEQPIMEEHGCLFYDREDWDHTEWNKFYSFMMDCCQYYLKVGLVGYQHTSVHLNRLRQNTSEDFVQWIERQSFVIGERYETAHNYNDFTGGEAFVESEINQLKFSKFLKEYANSRNWVHKVIRSNSKQYFIFTER